MRKPRSISNQQASRTTNQQPTPAPALSCKEQQQFKECEIILRQQVLHTFLEVGSALITIQEHKLYRDDYPDFASYCRERWGISRSYAWRMIRAAERISLLPENSPKPSCEFQVRPFLHIEVKAFPQAWEQAIQRSDNGKVTAQVATTVVSELCPEKAKPLPKPRSSLKLSLVSAGEILTLIAQTKRSIAAANATEAIDAIEKIKNLVFAQ